MSNYHNTSNNEFSPELHGGIIVLNGTEETFVGGDLEQISGDSTIRRIKIDDANDLENTLYFGLAAKDKKIIAIKFGLISVY